MGNMTAGETRELAGLIAVQAVAMIAVAIAIIPYTLKRVAIGSRIKGGGGGWDRALLTSMFIVLLIALITALVRIALRLGAEPAPIAGIIVMVSWIVIVVATGVVMYFKSRREVNSRAEVARFLEISTWFGATIFLGSSILYEVFGLAGASATALGTQTSGSALVNFHDSTFLMWDATALFGAGIVFFGVAYYFGIAAPALFGQKRGGEESVDDGEAKT